MMNIRGENVLQAIRVYWKSLIEAFTKHDLTLLAAAQAYYYLLSVVPLLFICFAIIPYFQIEPEHALNFINELLPGEIAKLFEKNIIQIVQEPKGGLLTIGIIGALWSASNGINAFIRSSNRAYETEESRHFIIVRFIALILTLGIVISFILAVLLPILGSILLNLVAQYFPDTTWIVMTFELIRQSVTIVVLTIIIFMLYRYAPSKRLPIKHLLPGALTASILWQTISFLFSFYIKNFGNYSNTYGSLGGLIILIIWFFLTGLILMIGIEINAVYHKRNKTEKAPE